MEKKLFAIIPLIMLFMACTSTQINSPGGTQTTNGNVAREADTLDMELQNAAEYLNTKIPTGSRVAYVNVAGGYPDLSNYILNDLSMHAVNAGVFSVVDRARLDDVRAELNLNMSGEVSDASAQAVGQMLGAQTIVSGSVQKVGVNFRLDIKAIEVQTATVQAQWGRNIPNGATIAALTENISSGGRIAVTSTSGNATQTPAGPRNGTYTFNPRPQGYQGGRSVDRYIAKIVVRSGFLTVYVGDSPSGNGSNSIGNSMVWWDGYTGKMSDKISIQDLDNPSRTWTGIESQMDGNFLYITFQDVKATRFTLVNKNPEVPIDFGEITLGEPD